MALTRKVLWWSLAGTLALVVIAGSLFYWKVGRKPTGVPLDSGAVADSSGTVRDTTPEPKSGNKEGL